MIEVLARLVRSFFPTSTPGRLTSGHSFGEFCGSLELVWPYRPSAFGGFHSIPTLARKIFRLKSIPLVSAHKRVIGKNSLILGYRLKTADFLKFVIFLLCSLVTW